MEGLIAELSQKYAKYQGVDRRSFLKSASGFAAAFLAMNKVFGPVWDVSEAEAADKEAADSRAKALSGQFIFDDPSWYLLFNDQLRDARGAINNIAGTRRMLSHAVFTPNQPGWMDEVDKSIAEYKPDSWKGYTIGDPLSPSSKGTAWRLDDEKLVYPFYEKAVKSGITTICIHKGLLPKDYETSWPGVWKHATVDDLPKAAKDWPQLKFIMYHGALRMFFEDPSDTLKRFEETGDIQWVTDLARMRDKHGLKNIYGELGTTFATSAVTSPRLSAAVVGSLVNGLGVENVVWGSDSVWYGSPQWQIEAFRRLEIPDDMMKKMGWKTKLGGADSPVKRKIFGENSAAIYGMKVAANYEKFGTDKLAQMKTLYQAEGIERNNRFYGYIGKRSVA